VRRYGDQLFGEHPGCPRFSATTKVMKREVEEVKEVKEVKEIKEVKEVKEVKEQGGVRQLRGERLAGRSPSAIDASALPS